MLICVKGADETQQCQAHGEHPEIGEATGHEVNGYIGETGATHLRPGRLDSRLLCFLEGDQYK